MQAEQYMSRCLDLAKLGRGLVSPNPLVGAVLVYENRIIGEGWHQRYGEAHAEVHCLQSVQTQDRHLIPAATLYCNLEPCAHFGKTPPCADLIIQHRIPRVVIANTDPNPLVAGSGINRMLAAGIEVQTGILDKQGAQLNRAFFTWIGQKRPYIILKWAQSADGYMGKLGERTVISGPVTQRLVHRWRTETDAIMVGTHTALIDNPRLDNRFYPGKAPLRIAIDRYERLPETAHLMDDSQDTWIIGQKEAQAGQNTRWLDGGQYVALSWLLNELYRHQKASLLVEGGAQLLQQFIDQGIWDEIRLIESACRLESGVKSPLVPGAAILKETIELGEDHIRIFAEQA
ncbi:MAG TPA: bifunctional diaminohydroxyphosphoribosylaminopyrimidine deaminase/5-amino-6-(5-phosphoribosylamino)uracil reductase RibD [Saprospiraceae bacterium]|nr:bifunctional diaminohydroxyphosphoribosylaminopyrimidine deaminase/5-amino-6-(5-phosphoribosylamino)uracil reductase RibD [Saprospiraceae bacterium]